jgi:hypothetical protein
MRARFKGDPDRNNSGPEALVAFGLEFSKGAWVGIDGLDPVSLRKIKGNSHFEVDDGDVAKAVKAAELVAVEEIPANWREAHHKTRVKWARQIGATPANVGEADLALEKHFAVKPAPAPVAASSPSIADPPAKAGDDDWGDLDPDV